jgi:hypothetical protein
LHPPQHRGRLAGRGGGPGGPRTQTFAIHHVHVVAVVGPPTPDDGDVAAQDGVRRVRLHRRDALLPPLEIHQLPAHCAEVRHPLDQARHLAHVGRRRHAVATAAPLPTDTQVEQVGDDACICPTQHVRPRPVQVILRLLGHTPQLGSFAWEQVAEHFPEHVPCELLKRVRIVLVFSVDASCCTNGSH